MQDVNKKLSLARPKVFIPSLYFAEGLPFTIVNSMSVLLFKTLGADNDFIGFFTSLLYIPWTFKLFWAPMVDFFSTRRRWIISIQWILVCLSAALTFAVFAPHKIYVLLGVFALMAFISATQDICVDGYYLDILDKTQQAFYIGVRNASYKIAWLFGSGALVFLAGKVSEHLHQLGRSNYIESGWSCAFASTAIVFLLLALIHGKILPEPQISAHAAEDKAGSRNLFEAFPRVFMDFIDQPRIAVILLYVLIFRLGDALLLKMAQPFLIDDLSKGGLALSTSDVGLIYGTVGTFFLFIGGILGGWMISKLGLRKCILPFALLQNLALPLYWYLAAYKPAIFTVAAVNAFEQFSYGLGTAGYTVFLMGTVKPRYKAAHYAIVTAFMALGVMLPGMKSGALESLLGYANFFLLSFALSLPGIILIPFLPLTELERRQAES